MNTARTDINASIGSFPADVQAILKKIRATIRKAPPEPAECLAAGEERLVVPLSNSLSAQPAGRMTSISRIVLHIVRLLRLERGAGANAMVVRRVTPILNVSNMEESFAWFAKLGWKKGWDWGSPATFGGVCSGKCEIFLCENGQGGRGRGGGTMTFGPQGNESADQGVWMSLWVDDVDAVYQECLAKELEVTWPPTDMPWNVREMHVRHPDGHVFRISKPLD